LEDLKLMNNQQKLVEKQFGVAATDYLHSPAHAQGADLQRLRGEFAGQSTMRVLDLGCGAGHASFTLAEVVEKSTAESLPFADAYFDGVVTRFSAHHWADVPAALREMRRVLHPQGKCVIIDVCAPENPLLDTFLQTVEILRDPSHVRDYRVSEWQAMLAAAES